MQWRAKPFHTWVSAKITRFPACEPTPFGIHVLITCGFNNSWSWSLHSATSPDATSSEKLYWIVFRKLYAGFGWTNLRNYAKWIEIMASLHVQMILNNEFNILYGRSMVLFIIIQMHLNRGQHNNLTENEPNWVLMRWNGATRRWLPTKKNGINISKCSITWFHGTNMVRVNGWNGDRWNCKVTAPPPLTRTSNLLIEWKKTTLATLQKHFHSSSTSYIQYRENNNVLPLSNSYPIIINLELVEQGRIGRLWEFSS